MSAVSDFMSLELTARDFGELVGISDRHVRRLIKSGKVPAKSQNPLRISVGAGLAAFISHLKESAKTEDRPVDDEKARSEKLRADADISIYKAKQEEAKWKEMAGQLHRAEDVQAMTPVDDEKARSEKLRADADISIYKAKQEEAKWKEMAGQLHRAEDVQAMTEDLIYTIRGAITALPGKLAMNVAAEDDPNVCSSIIKEEIILVLEGLSEYEYSKEKYLARTKEREGREAEEEDDF